MWGLVALSTVNANSLGKFSNFLTTRTSLFGSFACSCSLAILERLLSLYCEIAPSCCAHKALASCGSIHVSSRSCLPCYHSWNWVPYYCNYYNNMIIIIIMLPPCLQSINPILIRVYPHKRGWLDLPHFISNLSNSHSPSRSIHGVLFLQTNALALLLHLCLPRLLWSSSLPLALHFELQRFSQNMPIIPPQHMPVPSHSICL